MIVVDASVWVSYALPRDANHSISRAWLHKQLLETRIYIPTIALAEIGAPSPRPG